MKFDVLNRFTGAVQFTAEIECHEDAPRSIKLGLAIRWGIKTGADLADADLADADLADADLAGAYLADANLTRADLAGAYLADANLTRAYLADAVKINDSDIPFIPKIDAVILAAIEAGGTLDMDRWHGPNGWCGTTHCRAGWAVHCAGESGHDLEKKVGTQRAASLIYRKSRPGVPVPWFFAPTDKALADIQKCAAKQEATQ